MIPAAVARDGFAVVPDVLSTRETTALKHDLRVIMLHRSHAGIRHLMSSPTVSSIAHDPRLIDLARQVLGHQAVPFRATLFDKSAESNWLVVWHQDTALPIWRRKETPGWGPWSIKEGVNYAHAPTHALGRVVALRVHLDESNERNGPLRVLPGTHTLGVLSDEEVHRLSMERAANDCLATSGTVLVMRPLLIHSSSKSRDETPRRVLHIEYAESMSIGDGLDLAVA